ncbi:putative ribose-phosphate pyrophosphokinase [Bacillus phage BPS13]|uniref:ribose-phosphate diphosphokinase n=2 Tax=Wphvirus BPS13 TaxID=1987727 RepID=A0A173GBG1_9CAUD|nr:ribose-phosphate pyrophosphokinase [Bacillus phage BPS13]YP_009282022.1 ribose-phosphate pyrophosphokinase [Bacillus phage SalinJah]AEZ50188.1 putative ribose-phosphate pyrophosphokinase [Bacillus phage BPS13]ANH50711.1 ribose-phosphate pyrophosphokinase [Bacillus phage SalinJah]QQO38974.1 ribose-phosphate pyrophosphokinase [Bacillus phage BCPG1]
MIKVNDQLVVVNEFPNGESLVDGPSITKAVLSDFSDEINVDFKYENDGDLIKLMFVKRHIDNTVPRKNINLHVRYMPYSRMDRVEGNSVFTLKYVSEFINDLGFTGVIIVEPHSDVTPALIDKAFPVYPTTNKYLEEVMRKVGFDKSKDYLMFPDGGAEKRYKNLKGFKTLVGHKKRDFETGNIISFEVYGEMERGHKVIILDDLISKGGTFVGKPEGAREYSGAAVSLQKMGASNIYLLTAHCEDGIADGHILKTGFIDHVFTTDSMLTSVNGYGKITLLGKNK